MAAKCAGVTPFLELAKAEPFHVLQIRVFDHVRGKVKCPGGGVCETPFLVADVLVMDDLKGSASVGRVLIASQPEAIDIDRLTKGTRWIVAVRGLHMHAGADLILPACAEAALLVVDGKVIDGPFGGMSVDELRVTLKRR